MKKRFGFVALLLTAVFMLSSCEFIQAFKALKGVADEISDYNTVYVANGTSSTITIAYEEDATDVAEDATQQKGTIKLNKGATKEKAFGAGYYKLTINNDQVLPGEGASTSQHATGYYLLTANTKITIKANPDGGYIYTSESRSSN